MSQSHFYHQMKPVSSEYNTLAASTYSPDSSGPPSQPQQETATRQRGTRIVCMIARASSVIFDSIMFGTMTFVTSNLLNTQADQVGGRNIWPAEAITWPTYMFFAASLITLAIEILLFCIFWHRFSRPEQSWKLVVVEHLTQISMWAVVAFLYRYEQRSKGVWEWSCSDMAGTLRSNFNIAVNFNRLCSLQVGYLRSLLLSQFSC